MYGFDHGGWMFGGGLVMLIVWLIPFLALFLGLRYLYARSDSPPAGKSPREVLDDAYARSEISREEYLQKRDDLKQKS